MIVRRKRIFSKELTKNILNYIFSFSEKKRDYTALFEKKIAEYLGVEYITLVSSGRKGLELILKYFNFPEGSQIIMPAYTLKDLVIIVKNMGYTPVFVDVDARTCNMKPTLIEGKITDKTVLIIVTHLFGLPSDMDKILDISAKYNLKIIEDCAHSLGASYKGKKVGTFSDASFFSLELTKPINTFGGGIIATNDKKMYTFLKNEVSGYPYLRKRLVMKVINSLLEDIVAHSPLYSLLAFLFYFDLTKKIFSRAYRGLHSSIRRTNSKYSNFQAYLGYKAILEIDKRNEALVNKLNKFRGLLSKKIEYPKADYSYTPAFYFNLVRTELNCDKIRRKLLKLGIDIGIRDEVSDNCPLYFGSEKDFPNVNKVYNTLVQLPLSWEFNDGLILRMAHKLNNIVKELF